MGLPKTVRFEDALESRIEEYLKTNHLKFSQLLNMAVEKFISEPQSIELQPIDAKKWERTMTKAFTKHRQAMDKLK